MNNQLHRAFFLSMYSLEKETMVHLIYLLQVPSALASAIGTLLKGETFNSQGSYVSIWGLDDEADRVFDEVMEILDSQPSVTELSLVGVGIGGCILERVAQRLYQSWMVHINYRYFIAIASPLNDIATGWNLITLVTKFFNSALSDLVAMYDRQRASILGLAMFQTRICLSNLSGDWQVPLISALPVGGSWPWSAGRQLLRQTAADGSSCVWNSVILDLNDRWRVHHAIVTDRRTLDAIKTIIEE